MVIVPIHSRVTQARRTGAPRSVVACGIGYLYLRTGSGNSEEAEEESCQCSAKQRPDHRDPVRESSRAVRLVPGGKSRGPSTFSSTALERFRVLRPVARVQPTSAYLDFLASI